MNCQSGEKQRGGDAGPVGAVEYNRSTLSRQAAQSLVRWQRWPATRAAAGRLEPQETFPMLRPLAVVLLIVVVTLAGGCSSSGNDPSTTQEKFGVRMAKMNLWREAMFRFERAVEMNPEDAMAHNNLAVAYEANGDFESAAKAYREAMRLDRSNQYIQKNYSRFVEFTTRDRRRQQQQRRAAALAAADADAPAASESPEPDAPAERPASTPVVSEPPAVPTAVEAAAPEDGSPAPTGAAPAATPAPNPAPPQTPPPQSNTPPGGLA